MADVHNTGDKVDPNKSKQTGSETARDPQNMRPEKDPTEPMKHVDKTAPAQRHDRPAANQKPRDPAQRDGIDQVMEQWPDVPQGKQKSDGSGERT